MPVYYSSTLPVQLSKKHVAGYTKADSIPDCDPKYLIVDGGLREMTPEEKETYYGQPFSLAELKQRKIDEIDARTSFLIRIGFTFDGKQFSMSNNAQMNWIGIGVMEAKGMIQYPLQVSCSDEGYHTLVNKKAVDDFLTAYAQYQLNPAAPLTTGRALKAAVQACTTVNQVKQIIDNR